MWETICLNFWWIKSIIYNFFVLPNLNRFLKPKVSSCVSCYCAWLYSYEACIENYFIYTKNGHPFHDSYRFNRARMIHRHWFENDRVGPVNLVYRGSVAEPIKENNRIYRGGQIPYIKRIDVAKSNLEARSQWHCIIANAHNFIYLRGVYETYFMYTRKWIFPSGARPLGRV